MSVSMPVMFNSVTAKTRRGKTQAVDAGFYVSDYERVKRALRKGGKSERSI